ncbi:hypothetical protein A2U01_0071456, partial [Trifolium medium]|nr:hypothetical protein [Trifolium medium]
TCPDVERDVGSGGPGVGQLAVKGRLSQSPGREAGRVISKGRSIYLPPTRSMGFLWEVSQKEDVGLDFNDSISLFEERGVRLLFFVR